MKLSSRVNAKVRAHESLIRLLYPWKRRLKTFSRQLTLPRVAAGR